MVTEAKRYTIDVEADGEYSLTEVVCGEVVTAEDYDDLLQDYNKLTDIIEEAWRLIGVVQRVTYQNTYNSH